MTLRLAIVGHGFVGQAVEYGFSSKSVEKFLVDPKYGTVVGDLARFKPDVIFICVPTPMDDDKRINPKIMLQVIDSIRVHSLHDSLVVVKSTVTPDIIDDISKKLPRFVYNPEFLTERNANGDFINPPMHVFGSHNEQDQRDIEDMYMRFSICKRAPVVRVDPKAASLIKYTINSFLMSKVVFYNHIKNIVDESGSKNSYEDIIEAIQNDERMGYSHMQVPGPDSKAGCAGKCLSKDPNAFARYAQSLGTSFTQLEASITSNEVFRPDVYDDGAFSVG